MEHIKNILTAWHIIEYLIPHQIEGKNTEKDNWIRIERDSDLPWNYCKENEKNGTYLVSLGVCNIEEIIVAVKRIFRDERYLPEEINADEKTCFAQFLIGEDGNYIPDSFSLSFSPFAIGRLLTNRKDYQQWIQHFHEIHNELSGIITEHFFRRKVTFPLLSSVLKELTEKLHWEPIFHEKPFWVKKVERKKEVKEENDLALLYSFYVKDIEKVLQRLHEGIGDGLMQYLSGTHLSYRERKDLSDPSLLTEILSPEHFPLGKWPSDDRHTLNLMQQASVNLMFKENRGQNGLFSVNGPPGTGKTTLLKDVIARNITERAIRLAQFSNPYDAYDERVVFTEDNGQTAYINCLKPELTGFSMVIASSNNGAVENISKELPLLTSIHEKYREQDGAKYFRKWAHSFCEVDEKRWGLIAATLGNSNNMKKFRVSFWNKDGNPFSFRQLYQEMKKTGEQEGLKNWKEARISFEKALERVKEEQKKAMVFYHSVIECEEKEKTVTVLQEVIENGKQEIAELDIERIIIFEESKELLPRLTFLQEQIQTLKQVKFGFFQKLFRRKEYRDHVGKLNKLYQEKSQLESVLFQNKCRDKELENRIIKIQKSNKSAQRKSESIQKEIAKWKIRKGEEKARTQRVFLDRDFWEGQSHEQIHTSSPWVTREYTEARSLLFLESMKLHEAFIRATYKKLYKNLQYFNYVSRLNLHSERRKAIQPIWETFFMFIPVISTTFASFSTLFRGMGKESFGWLIIDEAGQAVPQAALGGMWRARHVVAVGDPLQIEPVVTLPESILEDVSNFLKVDPRYTNKRASVQTLADLGNPFGTYLGDNKEQWIGSPLWVHRRCIDPMFSVCNKIAYEGKMVLPDDMKKKEYEGIGLNTWIHVEGKAISRHYVKEQGEVVVKLTKQAFAMTQGQLPSLYIISPFTSVKSGVIQILKQNYQWITEGMISVKRFKDWVNQCVGTVHTFQGKEADMVILCLGVDDSNIGAASWATQTPNIMNVALSRAKYRIYVVGDKKIWKSFSSMQVIDEEIKKVSSLVH